LNLLNRPIVISRAAAGISVRQKRKGGNLYIGLSKSIADNAARFFLDSF